MELGDFVFKQLVDHAMAFERVETFKGVRDDHYVVGLSATAGYVGNHLTPAKQSKKDVNKRRDGRYQ